MPGPFSFALTPFLLKAFIALSSIFLGEWINWAAGFFVVFFCQHAFKDLAPDSAERLMAKVHLFREALFRIDLKLPFALVTFLF